jgi:hypothetical protein
MPRNSNKSVKPLVAPPSSPVVVSPSAPGLGQIVKEGMAFGAGNAVAHNIIGRLFSGSSAVAPAAKVNAYDQCLELTKNNHEVCDHLR